MRLSEMRTTGFTCEARTRLPAYACDSGQAAARIVAAALLSDGRLKAVETAALDALRAHALLGLARSDWNAVIGDLRHDLLAARPDWQPALADADLQGLLEEVRAPELRRIVTALSVVAIHADLQVERSEQAVLQALQQTWGLSTAPAASLRLLRSRRSPGGETALAQGRMALSAPLRCGSA